MFSKLSKMKIFQVFFFHSLFRRFNVFGTEKNSVLKIIRFSSNYQGIQVF